MQGLIVDRTHLVLVSGKLVLQKKKKTWSCVKPAKENFIAPVFMNLETKPFQRFDSVYKIRRFEIKEHDTWKILKHSAKIGASHQTSFLFTNSNQKA